MSKLGKMFLILFFLVLGVFLVLFLIGYFRPKAAGIFIDTVPSSEVYIDGLLVGSTPYEVVRDPGEITVKLVPQDTQLIGFETKVNLVSNVRTVIKREFSSDEDKSSGEIASFEKVGGKEASASIITIPDAAQISLDGQLRAFAPYKINSITEGEHELKISSLGFSDRTLVIKAYRGYKLTVIVKLAKDETQALPTPTPSPTEELKIFKVKILETPNNFLRVRSEPSTDSTEVARVQSGDSFNLVEEDTKTGWFKIEYEDSKEGWISNEYSEKIEQ